MIEQPQARVYLNAQQARLMCAGAWVTDTLAKLQQQMAGISKSKLEAKLVLDGSQLTRLDTAGAWLLLKLQQQFSCERVDFKSAHEELITLVAQQQDKIQQYSPPKPWSWLARVGLRALKAFNELRLFLAFLGEIAIIALGWLWHPSRIQWKLLLSVFETAGYRALPITGLLAFLIGIVLAYQMGVQLRSYGANIYIVNLLGVSILREFSPLITAIIIAGRSGSAFTAQLGTMNVNEEMDALRTMGISPVERLVLQRVIGLMIIMPLLTVWTDILGVLGGMVMARHMLDINFTDFLLRFKDVISLKTFLIGVLKAPVFAMLIASIGCFQGFQVTGSAESVGRLTTRSVVQAIFLIICADAFFSILLNWYGL